MEFCTKTVVSDHKQAPQTVSFPPDDFFLTFFLLALRFHRGMKSFFVLCDMLKAGFSFCNLGETANALDINISASLSLSIADCLTSSFYLTFPSCVKCTFSQKRVL